MSAGQKILDGLRDAVEGNLACVTIDGQRWVRTDSGPLVGQLGDARAAIELLTAELDTRGQDLLAERLKTHRLTKGIQRFLDGDYPNPRDCRPNPCTHGRYWYEGCEPCDYAFLQSIIATETSRGKP